MPSNWTAYLVLEIRVILAATGSRGCHIDCDGVWVTASQVERRMFQQLEKKNELLTFDLNSILSRTLNSGSYVVGMPIKLVWSKYEFSLATLDRIPSFLL